MDLKNFKERVVRPRGFEPLTYGLEGRCSIQLSYGRIGTKGGTRTPDLRLMRPAL